MGNTLKFHGEIWKEVLEIVAFGQKDNIKTSLAGMPHGDVGTSKVEQTWSLICQANLESGKFFMTKLFRESLQ
jgi:hypothetical protein